MKPSRQEPVSELRAFRGRLRRDHLLRKRLQRLKQEATLQLAQELGYAISLEDLQRRSPRRQGRRKADNPS